MKPLEILYVEDNPADVLLLQSAFQIVAFEPNLRIAQDGDAALKLIEKQRAEDGHLPDLILLDLNLPRLNGFEVLKYLRGNPAFSTIPVIVFSGSANPEDRARSMDLKADDFWIKPRSLQDAMDIAGRLKRHPLSADTPTPGKKIMKIGWPT